MIDSRRVGVLAVIMIFVTLNGFGAGKLGRAEVIGSIEGTKGAVQVDHQPALLRGVIFAGDVVSTGGSSAVMMNLLNGNIATLVENSEMSLAGSKDSAALTLVKGALVIRSGNSQPTRVNVPGASVIVGGGAFPSICRIASVDRSSVVMADKGRVEVHGARATTIVLPGKTVRLENGVPQGGGQLAGNVSAAIPQETIQRGSQGAAVPLHLNDTVNWTDTVTTLRNGRVRINLTDGSILNVGAGSTMHIVQHDVQSQQTVIELTAGTLRSVVTKRTVPGGKFETRTPTAVIGVVGTTPITHVVNPNTTDVFSEEGDVSVSNVDPSVPGTVILHTGQFTRVLHGLAPAAASTASAGQLGSQLNNTSTSQGGATSGPTGSAANQAGSQASASAGTVSSNAGGLAAVGAAGASAGVGGVVATHLSSANTTAQSLNAALNGAATSSGAAAAANTSAAAAAALAATAATQAQNAAQAAAIAAAASSGSGCGCVSPSTPE